MSAIPFIISALILFSTSPTQAQQQEDLGNLRLHEATFLTSHNAHANLAVAEGINLEPLGFTNQLKIQYWNNLKSMVYEV